jgi:hypothetical protein
MSALARALGGALFMALILAAPAQAEFGLKEFSLSPRNENGSAAIQAGSHPFELDTSFNVNTVEDPESEEQVPEGDAKLLRFSLPEGLIGSLAAVPPCATADFLTFVEEEEVPSCANATVVGTTQVQAQHQGVLLAEPVYNIAPPPGVAVKLGFWAFTVPITIELGVNTEAPNNVLAAVVNVPQVVPFYGSALQVWGIPADPAHDPFRGRCLSHITDEYGEVRSTGESCEAAGPELPFLTLPRSCPETLVASYEAVSWQQPDAPPVTGTSEAPGMTECSGLGLFAHPSLSPSTTSAESASGLDFGLELENEGLTNPEGRSQSDVKKAVVALPAGMTVNPSSANGLATCPKAGYEAESLATPPGSGCPDASKIGEVEVESPLLGDEKLGGSVFLASQEDNPFGSLLALYMVIRDPELGILVKRALKVEPSEEAGPNAGRLLTTLDEAPQLPFTRFRFHFAEGARAPLVTPPACGSYATTTELTPWANPSSPLPPLPALFDITSGVGAGPCPPGGVPPFNPRFEAGSLNNNAGAYSPFYMRLTRQDGEQEMTRFDSVLPRGVVAKLAGLSECPEAAIAAAKAKSGRQEIASPSCSASSEIGRTVAGAGVGGVLTWVPGHLYLGGPFAGDPLSVIAITPAVAGPFDVGTTVVHEALSLDPESAEVKVDGAHSDPIPHILRGIPLKLRELRVFADRPDFTLNPTGCAKKQARATLFGSFLDLFNPADDLPASLSARYQAASCASLKFKPKLSLALRGGTKRGAHPALTATLAYPPGSGYSNLARAVVTLPHSAFLEQGHIRTVCTRVQFAADNCPPGSIYGHAKAITPLLDQPLEGPVYLRSSSHPLPDLVFALHGKIDINVVGRIDSVGARIRTRFESVPDAPVSRFILRMQGAKKGLFVNSSDLCTGPARHANAALTAQSGRRIQERPVVRVRCG